ncbi:hypothetical protein L6Q21_09760 [Sandaracinobacter sp. RS1-74]|uniref:DUF7736 domain-containing protein n=1 Tax=Sandaracinobacteroides sayramensis TaxID=2913411 RepID=UPI001ED9FC75|nr:hypothetical protein [Sandaracinobacteroides sayramensis]MCG2841265.1 hypothetical protein [Sandaracinobacteroides sayramensis]
MTQNQSEPRLAARQLTREEAIRFAQEEHWKAMTPEQQAIFQIRQDRLCMPFDHFAKSMNLLLGRPVFTPEFADPDRLWSEIQGHTPAPDPTAIIASFERRLGGGGREKEADAVA